MSSGVPSCTARPAFDHHDAVAQRERLERVVGDEHARAGEARQLLAEHTTYLDAGVGVERGERLVEQECARLDRERPCERDALRLPARERVRLRARVRREAESFEELLRTSVGGRLAGAARPRPERDVVERGQVAEQQAVLEHQRDRPALRRARTPRRRGRRALRRRCGSRPRRSAAVRRWRAAACSCPHRWARPARPARRARPRSRPRGRAHRVAARFERRARPCSCGGRVRRAHAAAAPAGRLPNTRRPTSARTTTEIVRRTRLSTIAEPGSTSSARYTASGMVCVTPLKLPANVIVAPNSPSARAHVSAAPAASDGPIAGSVTRRSTVHRLAPSVAAASS